MATELGRERSLGKHLQKQMGCVAGFFQLFDRHQILTGKRIGSSKRRHSSSIVGTTSSESERSATSSPVVIAKAKQYCSVESPSPEQANQSPLRSRSASVAESPLPKSPIPLPELELIDDGGSSCRFLKEAPRLSLDSRATTDAKGVLHPKQIRTGASILPTADELASDATDESQQHRSPSVVVRLMGLEPFPDSNNSELSESKPQLLKSASESRVSRDFFPSRNVSEGSKSSYKQTTKSQYAMFNNVAKANQPIDARCSDPRASFPRNAVKAESPKAFNTGSSFNSTSQRKDFFPESKQKASSLYEEVENRLKLRGVSEHAKDLETLKQILEALHLKGLLYSRKPSEGNEVRRRNFVHDESPSRLVASSPLDKRMRHDYSPSSVTNQCRALRQNNVAGANSTSGSPRRERNIRCPTVTGRNPGTSPTRIESNTDEKRRSNTVLVKPKSLNVETQRSINKPMENRRVVPVQQPKLRPERTRSDSTASNRSRRSMKTTAVIQKEKITTVVAAEDESSSSSSTDAEMQRLKAGEYKEERKLLERCDRLIHSITEMANDTQPSPVSVLDSFYKEEPLTPSPITMKRNIDLEDLSDELEDGTWSPIISPVLSKPEEISGECSLVYISDILRATHCFPEVSDVFLLLEKQQYVKGKDMSKLSRLRRKVIFDTVKEILERNRLLPPWNRAVTKLSIDEVWSEFQRIREQNTAEDMFDAISGVLKKDLAHDAVTGWMNYQVEVSEMVLDIERLVFKDLITETIRDLVALESRTTSSSSINPRRKLIF